MYVTLAILFAVALIAGIVAHRRDKPKKAKADPVIDPVNQPLPKPNRPRPDDGGSTHDGNPIP